MQIAAYPPSEQWLTIPEFPPPGWERERARRQSLRLGLHTPDRRAELERLLREVQRMDRPSALARLLYLGDDAQSLFAVDIVLVIAHDDGTKAARHWAQQQLLRGILGPVQPVRLRPSPDIAGFWGRADGEAASDVDVGVPDADAPGDHPCQPSSSATSAVEVTHTADSRRSLWHPTDRAEVTGPGTAPTWRPTAMAWWAVDRAPDRWGASTTTIASASAAMIRLRERNRCLCGAAPGGLSEHSAPPRRRMSR